MPLLRVQYQDRLGLIQIFSKVRATADCKSDVIETVIEHLIDKERAISGQLNLNMLAADSLVAFKILAVKVIAVPSLT